MTKPSSLISNSERTNPLNNTLQVRGSDIYQLNSGTSTSDKKFKMNGNHGQRLDTVRAILFSIDLSNRFTFISPSAERLTGLKPQHSIGRSLLDFIHPDDAQRFKDQCLQTDCKEPQITEIRLITPENEYHWVQASMAPLWNQSRCSGFHGVLIDITKDRPTRNMQFIDGNRYHDIIENLNEGFFEANLEGVITLCNQALLALFGCRYNELVGKKIEEVTCPRTCRAIKARLFRMYKNRQRKLVFNQKIRHQSGLDLIAEFSVTLTNNAGGQPVGFQGLLRDVSEQSSTMEKERQLQAQIYHARKMNALETLAGGMANSFNNVFTAIYGNLSLIRMNLPPKNPVQKYLERIEQSAEKGGQLTRDILNFAKIGKFTVMPTNLNHLLQSTARMFNRSHPNLKIHESLHAQLWQSNVDRVQIGRVLLSLYLNAVEAMPKGGDIYLTSENDYLDETAAFPSGAKPGPFVKVSVVDSGIGFGDEIKERIFEPFFSAYRPLKSDKLGLAAAYGIIKNHKGVFKVESKRWEGTTFAFYLPASPPTASDATSVKKTAMAKS